MAASATNTYLMTGINAIFPWEARWESVQIGPSLTLTQGTILGEYTPVSEQQTLTTTGTATGGTFTLTFTSPDGRKYTTAAIASAAAASAVVSALVLLPNIGTGGVTATGGTLNTTPVVITFALALANQPLALLVVDGTLLTGSGHTVTPTINVRGINAGTYGAYASGNTDGTGVAKGILEYDVATDANNIITFGTATGGGEKQETYLSCPMFVAGTFSCADLTGLDATAVTDLGRLLQGSTTAGQFRMP